MYVVCGGENQVGLQKGAFFCCCNPAMWICAIRRELQGGRRLCCPGIWT